MREAYVCPRAKQRAPPHTQPSVDMKLDVNKRLSFPVAFHIL